MVSTSATTPPPQRPPRPKKAALQAKQQAEANRKKSDQIDEAVAKFKAIGTTTLGSHTVQTLTHEAEPRIPQDSTPQFPQPNTPLSARVASPARSFIEKLSNSALKGQSLQSKHKISLDDSQIENTLASIGDNNGAIKDKATGENFKAIIDLYLSGDLDEITETQVLSIIELADKTSKQEIDAAKDTTTKSKKYRELIKTREIIINKISQTINDKSIADANIKNFAENIVRITDASTLLKTSLQNQSGKLTKPAIDMVKNINQFPVIVTMTDSLKTENSSANDPQFNIAKEPKDNFLLKFFQALASKNDSSEAKFSKIIAKVNMALTKNQQLLNDTTTEYVKCKGNMLEQRERLAGIYPEINSTIKQLDALNKNKANLIRDLNEEKWSNLKIKNEKLKELNEVNSKVKTLVKKLHDKSNEAFAISKEIKSNLYSQFETKTYNMIAEETSEVPYGINQIKVIKLENGKYGSSMQYFAIEYCKDSINELSDRLTSLYDKDIASQYIQGIVDICISSTAKNDTGSSIFTDFSTLNKIEYLSAIDAGLQAIISSLDESKENISIPRMNDIIANKLNKNAFNDAVNRHYALKSLVSEKKRSLVSAALRTPANLVKKGKKTTISSGAGYKDAKIYDYEPRNVISENKIKNKQSTKLKRETAIGNIAEASSATADTAEASSATADIAETSRDNTDENNIEPKALIEQQIDLWLNKTEKKTLNKLHSKVKSDSKIVNAIVSLFRSEEKKIQREKKIQELNSKLEKPIASTDVASLKKHDIKKMQLELKGKHKAEMADMISVIAYKDSSYVAELYNQIAEKAETKSTLKKTDRKRLENVKKSLEQAIITNTTRKINRSMLDKKRDKYGNIQSKEQNIDALFYMFDLKENLAETETFFKIDRALSNKITDCFSAYLKSAYENSKSSPDGIPDEKFEKIVEIYNKFNPKNKDNTRLGKTSTEATFKKIKSSMDAALRKYVRRYEKDKSCKKIDSLLGLNKTLIKLKETGIFFSNDTTIESYLNYFKNIVGSKEAYNDEDLRLWHSKNIIGETEITKDSDKFYGIQASSLLPEKYKDDPNFMKTYFKVGLFEINRKVKTNINNITPKDNT